MAYWLLKSSQVKNDSPRYMEQAPSRGHEVSPQSGLGVGCKLCSSSKKLHARQLLPAALASVSLMSLY